MMRPIEFILGPAVTGWRRIRRGRPGRLALRLLAAAAVSAAAVAAMGWQPASGAVITGALTLLILAGRQDVAAGPRR